MKNEKEFIILEDITSVVQKTIRQWLSTSYTIEIIQQSTVLDSHGSVITTISLWRSKNVQHSN